MAVILFPRIQEIDICSNPLTMRRRGNPSPLFFFLSLHIILCKCLENCLHVFDFRRSSFIDPLPPRETGNYNKEEENSERCKDASQSVC